MTRKHKSKLTPKIYMACLAAYNHGKLHGKWIDATYGVEHIQEEIDAMLARSPIPGAEEWAIHDVSEFGQLQISEHENLEHLADAAELIEQYGELASHVIDYYGGIDDLDDAKTALEENYAGEYDSLADWAEELLEETGGLSELPANLRGYFDYESFARDAELGGDVFTFRIDGGLHVFRSN
jgi:antirestriction protein